MTSGNPVSERCGGTRVAGVGSSVGFRVGSSVGVAAPELGRVRARRPASGAGLRSLPAKQHALKARPLPATDRGRQGGVPGRPLAPPPPPLPGPPMWRVRRGETSHAWSRQASSPTTCSIGRGEALDSNSCYCGCRPHRSSKAEKPSGGAWIVRASRPATPGPTARPDRFAWSKAGD